MRDAGHYATLPLLRSLILICLISFEWSLALTELDTLLSSSICSLGQLLAVIHRELIDYIRLLSLFLVRLKTSQPLTHVYHVCAPGIGL